MPTPTGQQKAALVQREAKQPVSSKFLENLKKRGASPEVIKAIENRNRIVRAAG